MTGSSAKNVSGWWFAVPIDGGQPLDAHPSTPGAALYWIEGGGRKYSSIVGVEAGCLRSKKGNLYHLVGMAAPGHAVSDFDGKPETALEVITRHTGSTNAPEPVPAALLEELFGPTPVEPPALAIVAPAPLDDFVEDDQPPRDEELGSVDPDGTIHDLLRGGLEEDTGGTPPLPAKKQTTGKSNPPQQSSRSWFGRPRKPPGS